MRYWWCWKPSDWIPGEVGHRHTGFMYWVRQQWHWTTCVLLCCNEHSHTASNNTTVLCTQKLGICLQPTYLATLLSTCSNDQPSFCCVDPAEPRVVFPLFSLAPIHFCHLCSHVASCPGTSGTYVCNKHSISDTSNLIACIASILSFNNDLM
jgi:hypothetical protein